MKYFLITFGCQMNASDSEKISLVFENKGYKEALKLDQANLVVVNMCSVRQSAVNRVYGVLEKLKKSKAKTILTGCILKKDKKKFEKLFDQIIDIKELTKNIKYHNISGYVPIMTGCNNFCSYCVVPYTRGREISRQTKEIICEVEKLVKRGVKEIWLLGQNVNSYKYDFPKLLKRINKIPGKFWIRFTSSHPKDFSDDLIKAMKQFRKITPYLNLPVQSGDDRILKDMNRPYTVKKYKEIIKKVKKEIPNICLSTDVIVGFPGETKNQFQNTVKLFKEIKYDMAYISQYSPRPGTRGAKLPDNVLKKEKKRREKVLNEILKQTALENNRKYLNKTIKVLMINDSLGKTETNKTVKINSKKDLSGKFIKVKITNALAWGLKGKHVK
jgi:tRNA-2-methylthio-N6-dimethylallyladenosine synthase